MIVGIDSVLFFFAFLFKKESIRWRASFLAPNGQLGGVNRVDRV